VSRNVLADAARESLKILWWQLGWAAAVAVLGAALFGARAGWSALAGAGIGLIWTVYMAFAEFRHSLNHGVRLSALSFFAGWVIKVALTVSLLVIAFRSGAVAPLAVLAGLFGAMVAYWSWLAFGLSGRRSS
jgi:ATP synthase protein I